MSTKYRCCQFLTMERCFFSQPIFRGRSSGLGEPGRAPAASLLITLLERAARGERDGLVRMQGAQPPQTRPQGRLSCDDESGFLSLCLHQANWLSSFKGSGCSICQCMLPFSCVGVIALQARRKSLVFCFFFKWECVLFFSFYPHPKQPAAGIAK